MSFVKLPAVALVPHAEIERLMQKFDDARSAAAQEAFWQAIQDSKQPVIQEQPDYSEEPYWPQ